MSRPPDRIITITQTHGARGAGPTQVATQGRTLGGDISQPAHTCMRAHTHSSRNSRAHFRVRVAAVWLTTVHSFKQPLRCRQQCCRAAGAAQARTRVAPPNALRTSDSPCKAHMGRRSVKRRRAGHSSACACQRTCRVKKSTRRKGARPARSAAQLLRSNMLRTLRCSCDASLAF